MTANTARGKRPARLLRVALLAAALLGLSASTASADYGSGDLGNWESWSHGIVGNPATADVLIVGDSLTKRGYPDLTASLQDEGKTLATNWWNGRPTGPAVDWVLAQPVLPPILVMASGTNDIFDPSTMAADVARLRDGVPVTTRVYWVDVQASRWKYSAAVQLADQRNTGWVNNSIREQCTGTCTVIPWSWWFASSPNRLSLYLDDGVHQKIGTGTRFWAAVIMLKLP